IQAASASSSAIPRRAAMVPGASSPARAIASPRATTSWIPCSKPSAPLATNAVYSPRLCPAQAAGGQADPLDSVEHHQTEHGGGELGVLGLRQLLDRGFEEQLGQIPVGRG